MIPEYGPDRPMQPAEDNDEKERDRMLCELRTPMTVILGEAQMLRRRIRQGKVRHAGECMETLVRVEWSIRNMEARLRALEEDDRSRELPVDRKRPTA